ncbi:hypothetical protein [Acuticoccus sp.]|uniref:hypothetical protein n=1 Tax=Acuticoccus sp. TaxID=1904378 RepID=UPI003B52E5BB
MTLAADRPATTSYLSGGTLFVMLWAGLLATIVFDWYGQYLTPELGFARLAPEPLATQTLQTLFGAFDGDAAGGTALHWITGIVFYPVGYALIALPIARAIVPGISWLVVAIVYGVVLWAFALYVMAHLINGNPPFLGFTGITWVALIGHVIFAIVLGSILAPRTD